MCEDINCPNKGKAFCRCRPLKEMAAEELLRHVLDSITEIHPFLEYHTLTEPEPRTLRILGKCRNCGEALCYCLNVEPLTGGKLLERLFDAILRVFYASAQDDEVDRSVLFKAYLQMFHEGDKQYVKTWSFRHIPPEFSGRTIYTIVRSGCDMDRGAFPEPTAEGSYLVKDAAIKELDRLVEEEKKVISPRFDHEERGKTWWEVNEDGRAAVHFTRLEIMESELNTDEG